MLRGEARRAASILHQTPGWRWRRELCLTERSQQCQSGPTTKAWRRLPARQRRDACEKHRQSTCKKQCQWPERDACRRGNVGRVRGTAWARAESSARAAWKGRARAGCTARTRSTREWTPRDMRAALEARRSLRRSECGWHRQTALSERVRVAPPGTPGTSAESPIEAGPSYRSCTASPQRRRGVTVPSLIETICEL